jgi:hypothetical protein
VILGIIKYALSNTQVKCPRMRHKFWQKNWDVCKGGDRNLFHNNPKM